MEDVVCTSNENNAAASLTPSGSPPWGAQLPTALRPDGRQGYLSLRPPSCAMGLLTSASGSARFEMGLTSVLAAVQGPVEGSTGRRGAASLVGAERGFLQVVMRPLYGSNTSSDKYIEVCVQQVLSAVVETFRLMRTAITLILQPESDDGGLLSCCINAAIAALFDAEIPMQSTFIAVPLGELRTVGGRTAGPSSLSSTKPHVPVRFGLDPTLEELMMSESAFREATYVACTVDIHNGGLVQVVPEHYRNPPAAPQPGPPRSEMSCGKASLFQARSALSVDRIAVAAAAAQVLALTLRSALQKRLDTVVWQTFKANNAMELPQDTDNPEGA